MAGAEISGAFLTLFLYDVADEIRLEELRELLKAPRPGREPPFRQPAPGYVQFARPPVAEPVREIVLGDGTRINGRVAYYDYGVVGLQLEMPFAGTWQDAIGLSARWMNAPELEQQAADRARRARLAHCICRSRRATYVISKIIAIFINTLRVIYKAQAAMRNRRPILCRWQFKSQQPTDVSPRRRL